MPLSWVLPRRRVFLRYSALRGRENLAFPPRRICRISQARRVIDWSHAMKSLCFTCLFLVFTSTFGLTQSSPVAINNRRANVASPASTPSTDPKAKIFAQYGSLPLSFEANQGQVGRQVNFLSRTNGYSLFLASDEAVFALSTTKRDTYNAKNAGHARMPQSGVNASKGGGVLRMKLVNANAAAKVTGVNELPGKTNYFIGNDPKKWRTNIPTFAKVKYEGVYSGIDLVYYGNQKKVEYDFVVAPGADPRCIQFEVRGTTKINRDRNGDLVLHMAEGEIRWQRPFVYQETDGVRREIAAHYVVQNANRVAFGLAKYDASKPLYIDPVIYSTYLGGGQDVGVGITTDSSGNAYVVGQAGYNFPVTSGAFQPVNDGPVDGFVSKINPAGSALIYSTYLGGSSQLRYNYDGASGIAVDSSGNAYVTGSTSSTNFPTTPSAFQTTLNGTQNAFVTELNPTGSALIYSTYLGGSSFDEGRGIALDSLGNAYVTGSTSSTNFPVTPGAFQTTNGGGLVDAFVTRLNPSGSALVYSTYLGGSSFDVGAGIAVDSSRNAYVVGSTSSPNFPTTPGSFQTSCGNSCANEYAFVSKLNSAGSALIYSTYLGDSSGGAIGLGIVVGSSGDAYVTGGAGLGFPSTPGAFQTTLNGPQSAFVTELNSTGSALIYSTYLGGSSVDEGTGIALDSSGNTYITGETKSTNFPVTPGAFQKTCGGGCSSLNSFVSEINPTGSALVYSTYLGGSGNGLGGGDVGYAIAVDSSGNTYVTGLTNSTDFPTVNPLQPNYEGG